MTINIPFVPFDPNRRVPVNAPDSGFTVHAPTPQQIKDAEPQAVVTPVTPVTVDLVNYNYRCKDCKLVINAKKAVMKCLRCNSIGIERIATKIV